MDELDTRLLERIQEFGEKPAAYRLDNKSFNLDGYKIAIRRATRDLTARTLMPKKPESEEKDGKTLIAVLLDEKNAKSFLKQIKAYFQDQAPDDETKFDGWHHDRCNEVLSVLRCFYTNRDGSEVHYGKAQKIVNMTLKGCYCLQGARNKEKHFEHCHMALDSFTLAWYKRTLKKKKITITVDTAWSNLDETEYKDIQYNRKEASIRGLKMDMPLVDNLTPLQKEFLIWPVEIMIDTVKAVNKCFGGMVDGDYVGQYFDTYDLTNDLAMANMILGKAEPDGLNQEFIDWLKKIPGNQTGKKKAAEFILEKNGIF